MSTSLYEARLESEKKKVLFKGFFINAFLVLYGFFALENLIRKITESPVVIIPHYYAFVFPLSLIFGLFWTLAPTSAGRSIVTRVSPLLKGKFLQEKHTRKPWYKTFTGVYSLVLFFLTVALGWSLTEGSFYALFSSEGLQGAQRIFESLFKPEMSILSMVLDAMLVTIFLAFMSTALAIPIAFLFSFFCARNLMKGKASTEFIYNFIRFIANFTRSIEPLIWAIVFSVWVGIGPFAGMLSLMVHSVASLVKLYSEQIENIDRGPVEAIEATGANVVQVVWYAIVPQVVLPFLSFTIYRWDINIRMATIIGLVGGGGVGTLLMQYQGLAKWHEVGTIVLTIAVVVWVMDYLSAKIREAIY